ncbi:MAG: CDP-alcohol phosphatidyltransferase family protein [Candidatus Hodarchaeota archaeon]
MSDLEHHNKKRANQKQLVNKFIDGPVNFLIRHNFTPNILSFIGFLFSLGATFLIAINFIYNFFWFAWLVPFLMFWAGGFDVFDGEVARRTGKLTKTGAFLDSNLDRLSDAIMIFGLIYGGLINFVLGYFIMFLILMISYIRARAENEGIDMKGVGFMERAERLIIIMVALSIETWVYHFSGFITGTPWLVSNPLITSIPVTWFFLFFVIGFTLLLIITLVQRLIFTFKSLSKVDAQKE